MVNVTKMHLHGAPGKSGSIFPHEPPLITISKEAVRVGKITLYILFIIHYLK